MYNSIEGFRQSVIVYKNYVLALIDTLYEKITLINNNKEVRENELVRLKEDIEKMRKEIIELNKELD